jgi:hypothetical protein
MAPIPYCDGREEGRFPGSSSGVEMEGDVEIRVSTQCGLESDAQANEKRGSLEIAHVNAAISAAPVVVDLSNSSDDEGHLAMKSHEPPCFGSIFSAALLLKAKVQT